MLYFNNDLIQNLYEIVDDILFILDVPKLYHSLPHHFTSSEWPCHITNPEPSSYSPPKKQHGNCKVSLHRLKQHCQKSKLSKASMQKLDSPCQLGGGVKPSTSISKARLQPYLSASINLDTMQCSSFTFVTYVSNTDIDLYLKQDSKWISRDLPIHIICEFLPMSDIQKLALSHLGQCLPTRLNKEGCINALQDHCCQLCQRHRAIFTPNFHDDIKKAAKRNQNNLFCSIGKIQDEVFVVFHAFFHCSYPIIEIIIYFLYPCTQLIYLHNSIPPHVSSPHIASGSGLCFPD